MKLDLTLKIWLAWQSGDAASIEFLIQEAFGGKPMSGRLPSARWKFTNTTSKHVLIKGIMLSHKWTLKHPDWECVFKRGNGPPIKLPSQFSWRFPFIIIEE